MINETQIREKLDQISVQFDLIRNNLATNEQKSRLPKLTTWSAELYGLLRDPDAVIKDEDTINWLAGKKSLLNEL